LKVVEREIKETKTVCLVELICWHVHSLISYIFIYYINDMDFFKLWNIKLGLGHRRGTLF
jgi:hypothetical protein